MSNFLFYFSLKTSIGTFLSPCIWIDLLIHNIKYFLCYNLNAWLGFWMNNFGTSSRANYVVWRSETLRFMETQTKKWDFCWILVFVPSWYGLQNCSPKCDRKPPLCSPLKDILKLQEKHKKRWEVRRKKVGLELLLRELKNDKFLYVSDFWITSPASYKIWIYALFVFVFSFFHILKG